MWWFSRDGKGAYFKKGVNIEQRFRSIFPIWFKLDTKKRTWNFFFWKYVVDFKIEPQFYMSYMIFCNQETSVDIFWSFSFEETKNFST